MPEEAHRIVNFQPQEGISEPLGVTKAEFTETVLKSFIHTPRDCHASPHDLPVVLKGRRYRLQEIAHVQIYDPGISSSNPGQVA